MTESFPDCITEKKKLAIPFPGGFTLASGEKLFHIDIAYETWGTLNAQKDNAILIIHALTGDAHAAGRYNGDDEEPGWWDHLIGPGKSIDTEKYFVICSNNLGGCKGSTGPLSINPVSGRIFGADFPEINITDMVNVQKMLLDFFGIARLHAVIGGSMGGMIALEWSLRFPSMVKKCIPVAAALQLSPQALAFDIVGRDLITEDQHWHKGAYHEYNEIPQNGLAQARKIGHITYLSSKTMSNKFGREIRQNWIRKDRHKFHTDFQVESYLEHQGNKFTGRFDANSYLYITLAMDKFDLEKNACSRFAAGQSEFLILSITSDWLFPPEQQLEITRILLKARRHVSYVSIESDYGHDAFLIENESLSKSISAFLNADCTAGKEIPQCRKCTGTLAADDYGRISSFINSGEKVIDIGCGDGSMLCRLRLEKNISPLGIDISIEKIIECLKRGIPCLHLDADIGLDVIANDAFDTAVTHN
ncbi:MAG TPA: homoserine O-acetyltransferase, partial [Spirochaetia bacterium]|nr:homoserine O-acetyltransferase [Spirochaetia bacterium]